MQEITLDSLNVFPLQNKYSIPKVNYHNKLHAATLLPVQIYFSFNNSLITRVSFIFISSQISVVAD